MELVLAIILGFAFGYVLYITGASSPKNIISMLRLQDLTLMKIIVFGIGFGSTLLAIFSLLGIFNIDHLNVKSTNLGVIIGGLLFGIGFGTVGTCPGTCVAASGSGGLKKALSAIIGGLVGAFIFSLTYKFWKDLGLFSIMNLGKITLFKISENYNSLFSLGYSGLLLVGIIFIIFSFILSNRKRA